MGGDRNRTNLTSGGRTLVLIASVQLALLVLFWVRCQYLLISSVTSFTGHSDYSLTECRWAYVVAPVSFSEGFEFESWTGRLLLTCFCVCVCVCVYFLVSSRPVLWHFNVQFSVILI